MRFKALVFVCLFIPLPAVAQMSRIVLETALEQAEGAGAGVVISLACGNDPQPIVRLVERLWRCSGATSDQLSQLNSALKRGQEKYKSLACPATKSEHAATIGRAQNEMIKLLIENNCPE